MDLKPLVYDFHMTEKDGKPAFYLNLCTGSTDNVKPELVVEALFNHIGLEYNPNLYVGTSMFYDGEDYNEKNVFVSMQGGIFTYDIFTQNGIDPLQTNITSEEEFEEKIEDISIAANRYFYKMSYIDKIYTFNLMKVMNK